MSTFWRSVRLGGLALLVLGLVLAYRSGAFAQKGLPPKPGVLPLNNGSLQSITAPFNNVVAPTPFIATLPLFLSTNAVATLFTDDRAPAKLARKLALRVSNHLPFFKQQVAGRLLAHRA